MNKRNARKRIAEKIAAWHESITNSEVRKVAEENTIVTGGAIASLLLGERVNDYDVYFRTLGAARKISDYYADRWTALEGNDSGLSHISSSPDSIRIRTLGGSPILRREPEESDEPTFEPVFITPVAITLTDDVQLVFRFFGEPDEIHSTYDFAHCTNYWTSWEGGDEGKLHLKANALESLLAKELRYMGSEYPVSAMIRVRKFVQRGWYINAGQLVKIAFAISELDLSDPEVFEDQLVGVDVLYFGAFVKALKKKRQNEEDFNPTYAYVSGLIDGIFED